MKNAENFQNLVAIMARLRGPDGCPWDREQDYASLRSYLIEECYEVAEALDRGDAEHLREELGDLLFQIVFLSRIAEEEGSFAVGDVIEGIATKMIRRHPHVFGDESAETSEDVLQNWERIKRQEKAEKAERNEKRGQADARASLLDGIPRSLPALTKAQRLGEKAARVGFDWTEPSQILEKVEEELAELRQAMREGDAAGSREEIGDVLFSLAMLSRRLEIDPEGALELSNLKFRARFGWIEAELEKRGVAVDQAGTSLLEELWTSAKAERRKRV